MSCSGSSKYRHTLKCLFLDLSEVRNGSTDDDAAADDAAAADDDDGDDDALAGMAGDSAVLVLHQREDVHRQDMYIYIYIVVVLRKAGDAPRRRPLSSSSLLLYLYLYICCCIYICGCGCGCHHRRGRPCRRCVGVVVRCFFYMQSFP